MSIEMYTTFKRKKVIGQRKRGILNRIVCEYK